MMDGGDGGDDDGDVGGHSDSVMDDGGDVGGHSDCVMNAQECGEDQGRASAAVGDMGWVGFGARKNKQQAL